MANTDEAVKQLLARRPFAVLGYSAEDAVWCPACLRSAAGLSPGRPDTCGQPIVPLYARDSAVREEICENCERSLYDLLAAPRRHDRAEAGDRPAPRPREALLARVRTRAAHRGQDGAQEHWMALGPASAGVVDGRGGAAGPGPGRAADTGEPPVRRGEDPYRPSAALNVGYGAARARPASRHGGMPVWLDQAAGRPPDRVVAIPPGGLPRYAKTGIFNEPQAPKSLLGRHDAR